MNKENELKEQKLLLFIKNSLLEYQQGNKAKFNSIIDEISNRSKSEDLLRLWLQAMLRMLGESQKNKAHVIMFIKTMLTKTSWFHSPNHLRVHHLFRKLLSMLLSLFYELVDFVLKYLLSKIIEDENDSEETKQQSRFQILDKEFSSSEELLRHIRMNILLHERYDVSLSAQKLPTLGPLVENDPKDDTFSQTDQRLVRLTENDHKFMHEVFKHHKHYQEKFQDFGFLAVGDFTPGVLREKTRCFFVVRNDTSKKAVDISYLKSVQFLVEGLCQKGEVFSSENLKRIELIASLLGEILKTYPLSKNSLLRLLDETFPHKRSHERVLQLHLGFLLAVATQIPKILPEILGIAMEKLIAIDVEIKLEDHNTRSFNEEHSNNTTTCNDENARKLDLLMTLMFSFIDSIVNNRRSSIFKHEELFPDIKKLEIFSPLLSIFQDKILLIYQSKYTQFVLFFLSCFHERSQIFIEEFLSLLITNSLADDQAKIVRNNSISYLSSFLARAKFLSSAHLSKSLGFMLDFLENFELTEDSPLPQEITRMKVLKSAKAEKEPKNSHFLLVLQSLLYVTCYHTALCKEKQLVEKIVKVLRKAQNAQGFQVISSEILKEFSLKTSTNLGNLEELESNSLKIELFFPFDPYLLKNSEAFIRDAYRFWNDEAPEDRSVKCDFEKETDSSSPFITGNEESVKKEHTVVNKKRRIVTIKEEEDIGGIKKIKQ